MQKTQFVNMLFSWGRGGEGDFTFFFFFQIGLFSGETLVLFLPGKPAAAQSRSSLFVSVEFLQHLASSTLCGCREIFNVRSPVRRGTSSFASHPKS